MSDHQPVHRIWLVRHGLSTANRDHIRQGQMDFELAPEGHQQAERLADRLSSEKLQFDILVASPLRRAVQTAEIVSAQLDLPIEYDARWSERAAGVAEGKPHEDLESEQLYAATPHAHEPIFAQAESKLDLHLRAAAALQALLRRPAGNYLVIAHGGVMSAAIRASLGLAPSGRGTEPGFAFDNTAIAVLIYDPDRGNWILERLNDTTHLDSR